ncbi:transposase domain-containing protein [Streptomyces sp. NPDC003442]
MCRREPGQGNGVPGGQKIGQDPTVHEGTPLGAQRAIVRMPSAIAESGSVPLNGQVAPREKRLGERIRLGVLTEEIRPELVDEVVELTGCGERRRRLLPARAVVYFVLALCLFSSSDSAGPPGYRSVLRTLTQKLPTSSALTRAAAAGRQTAAGAVRAAVRHAGHGPHSGGVRLRAAAGRLGRHRAGRPRDTGERGRVRLHRQGKCQPERASTGSRAGCWPPCDRTCCCRPTATSADTSCGARPAPPAPTWPGGSHQEAAQERLRGQKKRDQPRTPSNVSNTLKVTKHPT